MEIINEEWRPVVGRDGYEVSNLGRVRSVVRVVQYAGSARACAHKRIHKGRTLTLKADHRGYLFTNVGRHQPGKRSLCYVHPLVAEAWIGERPLGLVINHRDGNKQNNAATNLEYVTQAENVRHAVETGLMNYKGESHHKAIHTEAQIIKAVELYREGMTIVAAEKACGLNRWILREVLRGRNWKHLNLANAG